MDWTALAAVSGAVLATATILGFLFKHAHPRLRTARLFWQHLVGVEANPVAGQPRVPSLFERLDSLDARLAAQDQVLKAQDDALETIRHEVQFNNGSSVKDAVTRIENHLKGDPLP